MKIQDTCKNLDSRPNLRKYLRKSGQNGNLLVFETHRFLVSQFHCAVARVVREKNRLAFKSKVHMSRLSNCNHIGQLLNLYINILNMFIQPSAFSCGPLGRKLKRDRDASKDMGRFQNASLKTKNGTKHGILGVKKDTLCR